MDLKEMIKKNDVIGIETILKKELEKKPQDVEILFKICLTELQFPLEDYESALNYINEIYKISPKNITALILESGINWHSFGFIEEELFTRLIGVNCEDKETRAIIYYLQSLYYHFKNDVVKEKSLLEKSINAYDKFVYPYKALGDILKNEPNVKLSEKMFKKAIENIQKIYQQDDFYDFMNVENYVSEYITGTAISKSNYEYLTQL